MMIRLFGLSLGLSLVMSIGLRAQDSLMLQIETQLNAPEPVTPEEEYYKQVFPDTSFFNKTYPGMGRFAFSVNGGGIVYFFGPMLHAEVGLSPKLRLDTHVRFLEAGIGYRLICGGLSAALEDAAPAPGLGLVYYFNAYKRHSPYVSIMVEYDYHKNNLWGIYDRLEHWTYHLGIAGIGGGWRLRYPKGYFVGIGGYIFYGGGIERYRSEIVGYDDGEWSSGTYWMKHPWIQMDLRAGWAFRSRRK